MRLLGPLVLGGAGGILAELYNDVVLRVAPVGEAEVLEMIGQVNFAVVMHYAALEAEANPVIVKQDGVVAVDALAVMKEE